MGNKMEWYDYLSCLWFAFVMTAFLFAGDLYAFLLQTVLFLKYETVRKI